MSASLTASADSARSLSRPDNNHTSTRSIVVVGNGPVGFRLLQQLVELGVHRHAAITVFGEDPRPAYDRVHLTRLLDLDTADDLQFQPRSWYLDHEINLRTGDPVVEIDRQQRIVRSASGQQCRYDQLILATGSRAFTPPIPGIDESGVFCYRTVQDLVRIRGFAKGKRTAAVLGGGLLGLEAAQALSRLGLKVYVVETAPVLMARQLDTAGAELLRKLVESSRIRVLLQKQTEQINTIVDGLHVRFADGESLVTEMVVVSAGIRPRDELAQTSELQIGRRGGVVVDDNLRTSDPDIFAIGECAVHRDTVYGLVAPGYRMAEAAARQLAGESAVFSGCVEATRLKLAGVDVTLTGDYLDTTGAKLLTHQTSGGYIKLVLRKQRIVGTIQVGRTRQSVQLQQAQESDQRIWRWNERRFERTGTLWTDKQSLAVADWPPEAVICQCLAINRGTLSGLGSGCPGLAAMIRETGASTVCGSCRPLLENLSGHTGSSAVATRPDRVPIAASFAVAVLAAAFLLLPPVSAPVSIRDPGSVLYRLVTNDTSRQVSGYAMTGLLLLALGLSLRKRTRWLHRFAFKSVRALHVIAATLSLAILLLHTGLHHGQQLNLALCVVFVVANLTGAAAGLCLAANPPTPLINRIRRPLFWLHLISLWPLPLLLTFHVIAVYWL